MATKITYNGKTTEIANGYIATFPCTDKEMATDIVIEAPSDTGEIGTDSALPIEVATEEAMTALLTSGTVGGVYKYVGTTTDTYENGSMYLLEQDN